MEILKNHLKINSNMSKSKKMRKKMSPKTNKRTKEKKEMIELIPKHYTNYLHQIYNKILQHFLVSFLIFCSIPKHNIRR